ncbi:PTS system trehalose(maltose)-specific transporter subunits IIBC [Citrobacter koseri]|uniref:PTS system trehalose(Maltose)-specific transporter subunits IIBC n=1 Tax=Citrobacter koseri TaxID=545 RepID=A0A2X2VE00_CITKO|nr:PTS system trehalose(maltose)-specific transporter subunits IIBC [Citrobacter koseri]
MVKTYGWVNADNALYIMLDMCSSAAFIILPILIGFTAAREFGGNPYLGATLGGILTHPALTNAWGVASGFHTMNFFGFEIAMIGYQGTVFPVLLAVWFMSIVEKQLRRAIPDALDLILTPFLTVIISGFIALLIIGPAGRALGRRYLLHPEYPDCSCRLAGRAVVWWSVFGNCYYRYSPQLPRHRGRTAGGIRR